MEFSSVHPACVSEDKGVEGSRQKEGLGYSRQKEKEKYFHLNNKYTD